MNNVSETRNTEAGWMYNTQYLIVIMINNFIEILPIIITIWRWGKDVGYKTVCIVNFLDDTVVNE